MGHRRDPAPPDTVPAGPGGRRSRAEQSAADLRRVYREHVGAVFAFFGYAVSRETAEDLTSATFERVIRSWKRFDPARASERTWILAIARNQLTDHHRRQRYRAAASLDEHPMLADTLAEEGFEARTLLRAEVRSWLDGLNERDRQVLGLRYGADLEAAQVAALMDLSEANVHQIVSRALRRLRERATQAPA